MEKGQRIEGSLPLGYLLGLSPQEIAFAISPFGGGYCAVASVPCGLCRV